MSSKTKKNAKSKKTRKITFLQGKEGNTFTSFKQSDGQEIILFFSELISHHPEYTLKQRFKKPEKVIKVEAADDDKAEDPKTKNPLKEELIFGATEIMRKIQRNLVIGVVISDPLSIHLQATLCDLCKEFGVEYLISKNLDSLNGILGISRLACFGFTEKVKDTSSLCHPLFQIFTKVTTNPPHEITKKSIFPTEQTKSEKIKKSDEDEFVFDMPPEENFFIEVEETNSPNEIMKFNESNTPKLKMPDFINVEETIDYFPVRSFFKQIDCSIPWVDIKSETKKVSNLGQQLFHTNSFVEPKTIQLTSSGRPKNRKSKLNKNK